MGVYAKNKVQVEYPLSEMLGTRRVSDFGYFWVFEYLTTYAEILQGWDPSLNKKFIYVSQIPYTHSLKAILYNILNNFCYRKEVCIR